MPMARLIVANLDYEDAELPARVRASASAAGTLLAALARDGDRLWTPAPVDPERVRGRRVRLASGRPIAPAGEVLAWAETAEVAAARARDPGPAPSGGDWRERLWHLRPPDPAVVDRVNHRRFAHSLGLGLPDARWIDDVAQLAPAHPAWVCKAPMSASGRGALRRYTPAVDASVVARARRMLARHGELLYEPWVDRVEDFGCAGIVDDGGFELLGVHRLSIDHQGVFRGIELDPSLEDAEVAAAAGVAARALGEAGYRGPFGIDAYRYRDGEGAVRLNPMSEINARLTFGHVARAFGEAKLRLRISVTGEPMPAGATPLLAPGADDATCAWIEIG